MGKQKSLNPRTNSISEIIACFRENPNHFLAVDTESGPTRGLMVISLADNKYMTALPVACFDIDNMTVEESELLCELLSEKETIYHNSPYDVKDVLVPSGFLEGWPKSFFDTINMAHWVNENRLSYDLDSVSRSLGGKPKNRSTAMQTLVSMENGWDDVPFDWNFDYSSNDAMITYDGFEKLAKAFVEQDFWGELWHYETEFIKVMKAVRDYGIRIDPEFCMRETLKGQGAMRDCLVELGYGNNLGPKNLLDMFGKLGISIRKYTDKGRPCFDKKEMEYYDEVLSAMDNPAARTILRYRGWQKTVAANYKAYLKYADENDVLHPNFKLHGTVTGRMSCSDPALQQIPRVTEQEWNGNLKQAFIPRDGTKLWDLDFSQLEFRMAAAYSEEPSLLEIFRTDRDLFTEMSNELGWPRHEVKIFAYLNIYGGTFKAVMRSFGVDEAAARRMVSEFKRQYPELEKMRKICTNLARQRGWVKYWTGRRRHLNNESNHKAFNSIIQGGAAELVKRAMIRVFDEVCDESCNIVLQVHDSIVVEVADGEEDVYLPKIKSIMENPDFDFGVPFRVEVKPWGQ